MPIEISATDVATADAFITEFLTESIEDGRFTQGTALHDLVVKAFSFIFAHIKKENTTIKSLQSLLTVKDIATAANPDLDRAVSNGVDAILSNLLLTRNTGNFARGTVFVNVSRRQDYLIPGNTRLVYDNNHAFYPDVADYTQTRVVSASELVPIASSTGAFTAYQFPLRVVAARAGVGYNVVPTTWRSNTAFSSLVTSMFSTVKFTGGKDKETTSEFIDRANSAVSTRNLINARSIDATLREKYSTIARLLTVGMGEPEMQRDLTPLAGVTLHLGGHYDVYLELPRSEATYTGQIGGAFARPDGVVNVFRDGTITDWTTQGLQVGDVIRLTAGLPEAPQDFAIRDILSTELRVSELNPFSAATDEAGTLVSYYIYRPVFGADTQILPTINVNATGETSKAVRTPNRILLPAGAHYDILDVAVIDPDASDPNRSFGDGFVHFPVRTNETPNLVVSAANLEYQVVNSHPTTAQSQIAFEEIEVEPTYNDKTLRVRYETLAGLSTVHGFTRDRLERVVAGNILARGFFPVYLSFTIPYKRKPTARVLVDEATLGNAINDFINSFDPRDVIDVSDIIQFVRDADTNIGTVFPFTITYSLLAPDGQQITYVTEDTVELDPTKIVTGSTPASLDNPLGVSLSPRTIRYMTTADRIFFSETL